MIDVGVALQGAFLALVALAIWSCLEPPGPTAKLPSAASRRGILGLLESLTKGRDILHHVYRKQLADGQSYFLPGIFGASIVLPPSMLQWLIAQPESHLSAKWAQMDALNIPVTFLRADIDLNPVHEPLVRRNLTAHLDRFAGDIWEEVGLALGDIWGKDTEAWREVNLDHSIRRVVARASSRVFVGGELCRDHDYIESAISHVGRVSTCGLLMNLFPSLIKRALGAVFTVPIRTASSRCMKHLLPMFSDLVRNETGAPSHLFSSWLVSNAQSYAPSSPERTPEFLSRRIMALNFAAIHTSTLTACSLLLDVFSHPPVASLLRAESLTSCRRRDETWSRARLNQMVRLDGALRESLRLWGLVAKAMSRKVIHPAGVILPDGQLLPPGATVCISGWGMHHDEGVYARPFEFVHDRLQQAPSDPEERATFNVGHVAAAVTDDHFAAWGMGKHACPGRFFAVDMIKIILTHVLLDYEVQSLGERPENMWIEYNVIPPPQAALSIRRRKRGMTLVESAAQ